MTKQTNKQASNYYKKFKTTSDCITVGKQKFIIAINENNLDQMFFPSINMCRAYTLNNSIFAKFILEIDKRKSFLRNFA